MRRYWVPADSIEQDHVSITGDVLHHIRDVCRMTKGSRFEILDGRGSAFLVEITDEKKSVSVAQILEKRTIPELPLPYVVLALSIPRFPVFEAILEKSVELGVHSIQPFFSDYSFIRKREDVFDKKLARFQKIILSATQQSGRGDIMPIEEPIPLTKVLTDFNQKGDSAGLFAYEGDEGSSLQNRLKQISAQAVPKKITVFVGSEGGFSTQELEIFKKNGIEPCTLGAQVLRVETACVALVSIIKYELGGS